MRFITEIDEFHFDFIDKEPDECKIDAEKSLGHFIAKSFGWRKLNNHHHRLEIEAFPIDKWIEFKQFLFTELNKTIIKSADILQRIKDLEFHGKPSGDTINNPK